MTTPQPPSPQPRPADEPAARATGDGKAVGRPAAPSAPKGPGAVRRTTDGVKRLMLVVIGAVIALFAVLNRQNVEVHWIFGHAIQTPLILALAVTFAAGAVIGWIVAKLGRRGAKSPSN